jgi:hypothetical protein
MGNYIGRPDYISNYNVGPQIRTMWIRVCGPNFNLREILIVKYSKDPQQLEPIEYYHQDDINNGPLDLV